MTYRFDFAAGVPYWDQLVRGCALTLWLGTISKVIGLLIGLLTVMAKRSRFAVLRASANMYIETIRNTSFLLQVLFIFFGLPTVGIPLHRWPPLPRSA